MSVNIEHIAFMPWNPVIINANGDYELWTVPNDRWVRPIVIAAEWDGTFNHDHWYLWHYDETQPNVIIDDELNKTGPHTVLYGHLNDWWPPRSVWTVHISAYTVQGTIYPMLRYEWSTTREDVKAQSVIIREQPVKTNPWGWPF